MDRVTQTRNQEAWIPAQQWKFLGWGRIGKATPLNISLTIEAILGLL